MHKTSLSTLLTAIYWQYYKHYYTVTLEIETLSCTLRQPITSIRYTSKLPVSIEWKKIVHISHYWHIIIIQPSITERNGVSDKPSQLSTLPCTIRVNSSISLLRYNSINMSNHYPFPQHVHDTNVNVQAMHTCYIALTIKQTQKQQNIIQHTTRCTFVLVEVLRVLRAQY